MEQINSVGIDPGYSTGGLVILAPDFEVIAAASWKRMVRKRGDVWRVSDRSGGHTEHRDIWTALDAIWGALASKAGRYHLGAEQTFIPHRGVRGLVKLIEASGAVVGHWSPAAMSTRRPIASRWRSDLLGLPGRTKAKPAELAAIEWARRLDLGALQANGHAAEAGCIAAWIKSIVTA